MEDIKNPLLQKIFPNGIGDYARPEARRMVRGVEVRAYAALKRMQFVHLTVGGGVVSLLVFGMLYDFGLLFKSGAIVDSSFFLGLLFVAGTLLMMAHAYDTHRIQPRRDERHRLLNEARAIWTPETIRFVAETPVVLNFLENMVATYDWNIQDPGRHFIEFGHGDDAAVKMVAVAEALAKVRPLGIEIRTNELFRKIVSAVDGEAARNKGVPARTDETGNKTAGWDPNKRDYGLLDC